MYQVSLVTMPYELLNYPNIGVSVLTAGLRKDGISTQLLCPKFQFAEDIGLLYYVGIAETPSALLMGEWTFSHLIFPGHESDYQEFLKEKRVTYPGLLDGFHRIIGKDQDIFKVLEEIRGRSEAFIERTAQDIIARRPRIVGCGSAFQQHCASLALLKRIKRLNPSIITLMGGSNCEGVMGITNKRLFPWVDFVVAGEADNIFSNLCRSLLDNGLDIPPETLPRNVYAAVHVAKQPFDNSGVAPVQQPVMDEVATPDYSDYFDQLRNFKHSSRIRPWLLMETSRGCWWNSKGGCTFCGLNGELGSYRLKSASRALDELKTLSETYAIKDFFFTDAILDMSYFKTFLPELAKEVPPRYNLLYEVKSNIKEHHVEILASAGVKGIQPGIENLDDSVLNLMNKGVTAIQNLALLKYGMEHDVIVIWNFMWGFPGEQDAAYENMADWLPWVFHLQPPNAFYRLRFDRFSSYHNNPETYNLSLVPAPGYRRIYPFDEDTLQSFAYYFEPTIKVCETRPNSPGILKLQACVKEWRQIFDQKYRSDTDFPLTLKKAGDKLVITDKRPIAVAKEIILEGNARTIYQECSTPVKGASLFKRLTALTGISRTEFHETIKRLKDYKILLSINGSFLSLALRRRGKNSLRGEEFVHGYNLEGLKPKEKHQVLFWEAS